MNSPNLSTFTRVVVLAAFYLIAALLGNASAFMPGNISLAWPPAGIALAAIVLFGYRYWPGVAAGSLLCAFCNGHSLGVFTIASALGNTLGAIVCAYLLERFVQFRPSLERVRDVAGFALLACALGTTLNALFEVVSLYAAGSLPWEQMFNRTVERWVPNALGMLLVAPVILVWSQSIADRWRPTKLLEAAVCMVCLLTTTILSFNSWYFYGVQNYPLAFLPYPFLVWSALRFGQRGATTATLVVSALAIEGLLHGQGPFATAHIQTSLMLLGCYIGVVSTTNMLLAASTMERAAALKQTAELQARLRAVVEDQTDLLCRFDRSGIISFVNEAYSRFQRKTPQQLIGSNFFDSMPQADREIPLKTFLSLTPSNPVLRYDVRVIPPHGTPLWQQCTLRALFGEDGQIHEFQVVIQDITQRKESEEAARLAAERLRAIMDSMADGVIVVDDQGRILSANPAAEKIFQRKPEAWLQAPARGLFDQPAAYDDFLKRRHAGIGPEIIEMSVTRTGKTPIPVDVVASEFFHGGFQVIILVVRDITERKRMEEQFRQSHKMEAIGRLAGGIAHDFNNLLQAMLGDCNLLSRRLPPDDPNREPVDQLCKTVERARALTQQLLAFSRKQSSTPKVQSLNTAVTEMHQLLKRLISDSITIHFQLDPHPIHICAEPGQLEQIILNLSLNARDAMPNGGLLTIETRLTTITSPDTLSSSTPAPGPPRTPPPPPPPHPQLTLQRAD
jgi:PAS domain S-box-containing protein